MVAQSSELQYLLEAPDRQTSLNTGEVTLVSLRSPSSSGVSWGSAFRGHPEPEMERSIAESKVDVLKGHVQLSFQWVF